MGGIWLDDLIEEGAGETRKPTVLTGTGGPGGLLIEWRGTGPPPPISFNGQNLPWRISIGCDRDPAPCSEGTEAPPVPGS